MVTEDKETDTDSDSDDGSLPELIDRPEPEDSDDDSLPELICYSSNDGDTDFWKARN